MESYRCQSCGAEILINDTTGSGFSKCIYCGSNVTLFKKEYSKLNLKKMVPFRTSEEEAINYLTNVLNYTRRNEILDVKRIFIPVRFCSYDFSYLCSYRYVVSSDEDGTTYDNNDSLIDGSVKEEMILETSIMNNLLGFHDLRDNVRYDFDPVKLGSISCEFSDKYNEENIIKLIEKRMVEFGKGVFSRTGGRSVTKVYNVNHYLSNTQIDSYTTLVPVYLVRCRGGRNYAVSGVINKNVEDTNGKIDTMAIIGMVMAFTGFFFLPVFFIGFILILVSALNQNNKKGMYKTQNGYDVSDNIRYSLYIENMAKKTFEFHDFK